MTDDNVSEPEDMVPEDKIGFATFLESNPPGTVALIGDAISDETNQKFQWLETPELVLHCSSSACRGTRIFASEDKVQVRFRLTEAFLRYFCRNCEGSGKLYALRIQVEEVTPSCPARITKIGELPNFGPPIPPRVIEMVGPDRELFLRGRRAENQGLGIGAYAYYRRILESQWRRIIGEIIRVCDSTGVSEDMKQQLTRAQTETQFAKALDIAREAVPESLKIRGHNPLKLLHSALSEGIHALSEEDCLELAASIRLVLTELAERIGVVLKDDRELQQAIRRLASRAKGSPPTLKDEKA